MFFRKRRSLAQEFREFFGTGLQDLRIVNQTYAAADLPNLQIALEEYERDHLAEVRTVGYSGSFQGFQDSLTDLTGEKGWLLDLFMGVKTGPVQYRMTPIDVDQSKNCVEKGVFFVRGPHGKVAAHLRRDAMFHRGAMEVEVMSPDQDQAGGFLSEINARARESSVYRGKIISLDCDGETIQFHRFAPVTRDQIVLPDATMSLLERNTVRFLENAPMLRKSGRSVKRGILLHGKPGTGKTYTAKWLGQSLKGGTVILLTGEQLWLIRQCCHLARMLAPSLVIMEDVDLIASARDEYRDPQYQISLHQLLNEMDGLGSDSEVIFLLTTNRPDSIEGAIAMRPGRVDQAIEFPLPDAECRRRLLALFGEGLVLALEEPERVVSRTEGASPAFMKELVRKASMIAAEEKSYAAGLLKLTDPHFEEALRELVYGGGELTRNLLGFGSKEADDGAPPAKRRSGRGGTQGAA
jgi:AAA+ superfamily predicted ATPase